jgi:urease accessory protein
MLIQEKKGQLHSYPVNGKTIDLLMLEWHEAGKRIVRKKTKSGREVSLKFLNENPQHSEGDVLFEGDDHIIAISILPCDCLMILPKNMFEMASVCYEIGNKHLPLFYENEQLLVPLDKPLLKLLMAQGYDVKQESKKLFQPLKTTVSPHSDTGSESLFTKIMKLKTPVS